MLRQSDGPTGTDERIHSTHLYFHTSHAFEHGWAVDWSTDDERTPVSTLKPLSDAEKKRCRACCESEADARACAEMRRCNDTMDLREWQQPLESAGYVAHREQFV